MENKVMSEDKDDQRETMLKEISIKLDKLIELMTPPVLEPKDNRRMMIGKGKDGKRIEGRINVDENNMWVSIEWNNGKVSPIEDFKFENMNTTPKEDIRKLYVKRVAIPGLTEDRLIEIGTFKYGTKYVSNLNLPKGRELTTRDKLKENTSLNRYYRGWFYYDDNNNLENTLIDPDYSPLVADNNYVVGITNGKENFYYDAF